MKALKITHAALSSAQQEQGSVSLRTHTGETPGLLRKGGYWERGCHGQLTDWDGQPSYLIVQRFGPNLEALKVNVQLFS